MSYFSRPLLSLGGSLFGQSIVKHVLTQGDTILIASLASQKAQGVYTLANNYGGLIARLVFQPIEESSRNYFGKLLSSESGNPSRELVSKARNNLQTLLKAYMLLSICVLVMGPTMAPLLLRIVAGSAWIESGAGDVLARYCFYIPLLAINGLTEAFVSSVATESQVNRQSVWMLAFSAGFAGAAYIFLGVLDLGAEGLVWANTLNMAFRIVWSTVFIASYMKRHNTRLEFSTILPQPMTVAAGAGAYSLLTRAVASTFTGGILDIIKGGAVAGLLVILM
jgi:oligosaccharide translocation protein RFT1